MTGREAFLQAIIAAPEDDTPRMVFADWLDEHGDPARAEFIRQQCGPKRSLIASAEVMSEGVWRVHGRSGDTLLADSLERELSRLPVVKGVVLTFRRGFVENVICSWQVFVTYASSLRESTPLREVVLTTPPVNKTGEEWKQLRSNDRMRYSNSDYPGLEFKLTAELMGYPMFVNDHLRLPPTMPIGTLQMPRPRQSSSGFSVIRQQARRRHTTRTQDARTMTDAITK